MHIDHVTVFKVDDLIGHTRQRHGVARQKSLALTHAQHQRRAFACAHNALRLVAVKDRERICAVQLFNGCLQRLKQVALIERVDQMRDDFGVGLAFKHIAFGHQLRAQLLVVFDDAVVYQRQLGYARTCVT